MKYKIVLNDDLELVAEVNRQLQETRGYCPCAIEHTPETKCICAAFERKYILGICCECNCGKYKIIKVDEK